MKCYFQEINYDSPRGRIAMKTHAGEWTTSYLLIHEADITDSGTYVCAPTSGGRAAIKVHVFLHGNFPSSIKYHKCLFIMRYFNIFVYVLYFKNFLGERPEAMQTGTSTYIANNIMQTILISIIISTYNIFQNFYTSILFSRRIPNEITWHTMTIVPKIFAHTSSAFQQRIPYEMRVYQRW